MKHFGDITQLDGHELPVVDCIIGGSPCQDLSVAGKREGLQGARSGLFMEQVRIVKEMREEDVQVGDTLILREWDGENYTGRQAVRDVSYVLRDVPEHGLQKGYCIIALTTMFYPSTVCIQNGNNNMHINNVGNLTIQ